ncbi:hypothetical protein GOP47_0018480 [Adiantum capillus-veneris]|uniref:FAD-binding FR-type domain-containing protein n=1 Tax=Adiantum capillus-veneris TaxID=13818 RepID=A0A9D4UDA5_ADICA|nr:hypothetical protein GOP47_0018480 [Adiantum capillus-veneris]
MEAQLRLLIIAKHALQSVMCAASLLWLCWWLVSSEPMKDPKYFDRLEESRPSRFFRVDGKYGLVIIYQAMPVVVVALLSFGLIEVRKKIKSLERKSGSEFSGASGDSGKWAQSAHATRPARPSVVTYPLVVRTGWWNPFGVLTAAEALAIVGVLFLVLYSYGRLTKLDFRELEERYHSDPKLSLTRPLSLAKLNRAAENLGRAALIPFALLWIPVSRGSPLLRAMKVPYEHAVKYHIWLAVSALTLLTAHSVLYIVYYYETDSAYKILEWVTERERCSLVAGLVAWLAGLLMWVTSLSYFRRRWYEIFFSVHHLYVVFLLFWLYHVMYTIHFFIVPVLLFVIDRFLRMVQSRQSVDVLSATVLESGAIQLRIATNLESTGGYHALSSWYLRFPSLSKVMKLQWHFFSVTSTPLDEKPELSIVIKPLGKWTSSLHSQLLKLFLRYKTLVLVGGGIGLTPLLAMLCDVLHRQRRGQGAASLPTSIHLYHCVRKPEELCVLNSIDPHQISPGYEKRGLRIHVSAFVTSASLSDYRHMRMLQASGEYSLPDPSLQETLDLATTTWTRAGNGKSDDVDAMNGPITISPARTRGIKGISSVSTKGRSSWVAATILASMAGFYILWGLSNVYIVKHLRNDFPTNFTRAHIVVASMILGTTIFGGVIVLAWWLSSTKASSSATPPDSRKVGIASNSPSPAPPHHDQVAHQLQPIVRTHLDEENIAAASPWSGTLRLGVRPLWSDIFNALNKEYHNQNIGVLVSGSEGMQADVAKECQRHTRLFDTSNVFHYHGVSFEL